MDYKRFSLWLIRKIMLLNEPTQEDLNNLRKEIMKSEEYEEFLKEEQKKQDKYIIH